MLRNLDGCREALRGDRPVMKPVFLIGFMATGKSTVGRLVAQRLGRRFVDLDDEIARAAGMTVADLFAREGEEGFRRREAAALGEACGVGDAVVATGGGAACREDNLQAMLAAGRVVALSATPAEVLRRAQGGLGRPLLEDRGEPALVAEALLKIREPFYARAHLRVDTVGKTPEAVADEIIAALEKDAC